MNRLILNSILYLGYVGVLLSASGCTDKTNTHNISKPNIILILTDDMGYGDLVSNGAIQTETPHLDKLANQGMRFTNFYVSHAICSASRAALLTGCYANRVGIHGALNPHANIGLNQEEETIAEILKVQGYSTAAVGKWHLGHHHEFLPLQHGFDEFLGLPYSNDMWPLYYDNTRIIPQDYERKSTFPELPLIKDNKKIREIKTIEDQDELTTIYTEAAVDFIQRNKENPFFLYFAHSMPHVPLAVSDKFRGKSDQGLYGDVMMEIDWSVGEIVNTIAKYNLTESTLIIFLSDNGPSLSFGDHAGSAGGLREGKGTSFEGGQRVPCIMKWPNIIPKGTVCNKMAATMDILPTLAAITNGQLPEKKIDGVNIFSLFKNEPETNPRRTLLYYYGNNQLEAVRVDNWKLIFPHNHRSYENALPGIGGLPGEHKRRTTKLELYDLRRDPGERYNVIDQFPDIVNKLQKVAEKARDDLGDSLTGNKGKNRREPGVIRN